MQRIIKERCILTDLTHKYLALSILRLHSKSQIDRTGGIGKIFQGLLVALAYKGTKCLDPGANLFPRHFKLHLLFWFIS